MSDCHYCGYHEGGHNKFCPTLGSGANMEAWQEGKNAGRVYEKTSRIDPYYLLGYLRGEVAAEEAENGCCWADLM